MLFAYFLRVELDRGTPYHRVSEFSNHGPVDPVTEIFHRASVTGNDDRSLVVRVLSFGFCVDSDQVQVLPHSVNQIVKVPAQISSYGDVMVDLIKNVELIECDGINFVESVKAGNVLSVALDNVNNIVFCGVTFYENIGVADPVFLQNSLYCLIVNATALHHS